MKKNVQAIGPVSRRGRMGQKYVEFWMRRLVIDRDKASKQHVAITHIPEVCRVFVKVRKSSQSYWIEVNLEYTHASEGAISNLRAPACNLSDMNLWGDNFECSSSHSFRLFWEIRERFQTFTTKKIELTTYSGSILDADFVG